VEGTELKRSADSGRPNSEDTNGGSVEVLPSRSSPPKPNARRVSYKLPTDGQSEPRERNLGKYGRPTITTNFRDPRRLRDGEVNEGFEDDRDVGTKRATESVL